MTAGHTGEVCIETGRIAADPAFLSKQNNMRQTSDKILDHFLKNNFIFSLHPQKTGDINPIVKTSASGPGPRHCSTTFYQ